MTNIRTLRPKIVHRADKIRSSGAVSAFCFASPKPIDLGRSTWSNRDEAVTCSRCLRLIREKQASKVSA